MPCLEAPVTILILTIMAHLLLVPQKGMSPAKYSEDRYAKLHCSMWIQTSYIV